MANEFNIGVGVVADVDSKKIQTQLDSKVKNVKINAETNLKFDKNILDNQISTYLKKNTKLTSDFKNQFVDLQGRIKQVDAIQFRNLRKEFNSIKSDATSLGKTGTTIFEKFKSDIGNFLTFVTAGGAVMGVISTFRDIVTEVKNIDTAMISLKKVTNETDVTYSNFLTNASQKAKELGSSISDLVNSTADFARLGYNLLDASSLAEVATLYKNVGDGIDISEATNSIISTMKAFDIAAQDSITIIDKYNEVGNNFSISSAGIGEALQRSASALVEAGNTIDEAIALTVSANNVVQNPEQVGKHMPKYAAMYI
jgi:hypothetical protein